MMPWALVFAAMIVPGLADLPMKKRFLECRLEDDAAAGVDANSQETNVGQLLGED
jgi:hypothetical protein